MKVLVRPCYDVALKNQLFEPGDPRADHHKEPWVQWKEAGKAQNIQLDTWDMYPLSQADLVWIQDLPASRREIADARAAAPNAPFVFQIWETPVDRLHYHDSRNHDLFDAIVTYNSTACSKEKRYFHYHIPIGIPDPLPTFKPFSQRKPLVMINTNTYSGWLAPRKPGLTGLPVMGPALGGWQLSWKQVVQQQHSSLYERRRNLARLAEEFFPNLLEIYGFGWQGEAASWSHKIVPAKPFKSALGRLNSYKLEAMSQYRFCHAFENFVGGYGYISEKIFDCFYAGVVPVYLGDQNITQYVPLEAFVDARQFKGDLELLEYLQNCSESTWQRMYEAGQAYLSSEKIRQFQTPTFAAQMLEIIKKVASTPKMDAWQAKQAV
jgi:hypothetical protein